MQHPVSVLLTILLVTQTALGLEFTVEATENGKPIPQSQIKVVRSDSALKLSRTRKLSRGPVGPAGGSAGGSLSGLRQGVSAAANPQVASANWCGAVNHASSANQIKAIHTFWYHPSCSIRTGVASFPQAAAVWAGIDGDTYHNAVLQAGTVCKIDNSTGVVRNEAWWQWLPEPSQTIASMPVNAGDLFELTITTTNNQSAQILLVNHAVSQAYLINLTGGPALGRVDADWIVEVPGYGSGLAGFATFSDNWFLDAYATRVDNTKLGILGAVQFHVPNQCASEEWDDASTVSWSL